MAAMKTKYTEKQVEEDAAVHSRRLMDAFDNAAKSNAKGSQYGKIFSDAGWLRLFKYMDKNVDMKHFLDEYTKLDNAEKKHLQAQIEFLMKRWGAGDFGKFTVAWALNQTMSEGKKLSDIGLTLESKIRQDGGFNVIRDPEGKMKGWNVVITSPEIANIIKYRKDNQLDVWSEEARTDKKTIPVPVAAKKKAPAEEEEAGKEEKKAEKKPEEKGKKEKKEEEEQKKKIPKKVKDEDISTGVSSTVASGATGTIVSGATGTVVSRQSGTVISRTTGSAEKATGAAEKKEQKGGKEAAPAAKKVTSTITAPEELSDSGKEGFATLQDAMKGSKPAAVQGFATYFETLKPAEKLLVFENLDLIAKPTGEPMAAEEIVVAVAQAEARDAEGKKKYKTENPISSFLKEANEKMQ